jgi:hypothetical protein
MEIIHHIFFNSLGSLELLDQIFVLGIKPKILELPGGGGQLVTFDVSESAPEWEVVFGLLKKKRGFDIYHGGDQYDTFFSEQEIRNSEWLRLIPCYYQGHSHPDNWPFQQSSLSNVCPWCGVYEQKGSIKFYNEPSMRKNAFLTLNGSCEIFALSKVLEELQAFGVKGLELLDVNIHKTKQVSGSVKQLYLPKTMEPGLIGTHDMRQVICPQCGVTKYYSHLKGVMRFKQEIVLSDTDFMRTYEWFGVGKVSFREILVSNRVAQFVLDKKWAGVRFKVVNFE